MWNTDTETATYTRPHKHAHTHTHAGTLTHARTHARTHTHTHTHTQVHSTVQTNNIFFLQKQDKTYNTITRAEHSIYAANHLHTTIHNFTYHLMFKSRGWTSQNECNQSRAESYGGRAMQKL